MMPLRSAVIRCGFWLAPLVFCILILAPAPALAQGGVEPSQVITSAGLGGQPVNVLLADQSGRVWVGTDSAGLAMWDGSGWRLFAVGGAPGSRRVTALYQDSSGRIWVGSDAGIGYLECQDTPCRQANWRPVAVPNDLPGIPVWSAAEDKAGRLWVATAGGAAWWSANSGWQPVPALAGQPVTAVYAAADGAVWFATQARGLLRLAGGQLTAEPAQTPPPFQGSAPHALVAGPDGALYVGTNDRGLWRYTAGRWEPAGGMEPVGAVLALASAGGYLWFGAPDGLRRSDGQTSRAYPGLALPDPNIRTVAVQPDGTLWIGTGAGLVRYVPGPAAPSAAAGLGTQFISGHQWLLPSLAALVVAAGAAAWYRRTRSRRSMGPVRNFNPYIAGEPIRDPAHFFGRDELLSRIVNALHQNSILITGERRSGKTSLLFRLAGQLRILHDPEWAFVPAYVDLEGTPQDCFFSSIMAEVVGGLPTDVVRRPGLRLSAARDMADYGDRDFVADLRTVLDALQALYAPRKVRLALLLDEVDVINSYDSPIQQQFRRVFMSSMAESLGAVLAGSGTGQDWEQVESPWYNLFSTMALPPFSEDEARRLLVEPVAGVYDWSPEALSAALAWADGRPYRLQQLGLNAVNQMLSERRARITEQDVRAAIASLE